MEQEIINCFELDVRQDIPAEMDLLASSNRELKKSNHHLTIILLSVGLGTIVRCLPKFKTSNGKKEQ